jgi:hypothetical protein
MDPMIVNEDSLHFEIGSLTILLVAELNESVLKTVAGLLVSYHFTRQDLAESGEDELQVFIPSDRIELADE